MKQLLIVWKSDNDTDIHNFIFPYALNSKKNNWFSDVSVLIWGASQEKVLHDESVQHVVKTLHENGVKLLACKYCADKLNASTVLSDLGVTVMYTGVYLSEQQKDDNVEVLSL